MPLQSLIPAAAMGAGLATGSTPLILGGLSMEGGIMQNSAAGAEARAQREFNLNTMREQMAFQDSQAQIARGFDERMSSTAWQRATADMKAAGLNPMLAYSQGGASSPTSPSPTGSAAQSGMAPQVNTLGPAVQSALEASRIMTENENIRAQTAKTGAEQREIEARTPTYAANIDKIRQDINQSIATVSNLQQQTRTGIATAAQLEAQTRQIDAAIPQIEATTRHMNALVGLVQAQTATEGEKPRLARVQADAAIAQLGLTDQETQKLKQYISANLPQIQRSLAELEAQKLRYQQPGQRNEAVAQDSLLGAWSTALKHIIPIGGILGLAK